MKQGFVVRCEELSLSGEKWRRGGWKLTVDIFFGQIKCGSHCPFFCSMNRVYLYTAPTFPRSQPCTGLWSELDGVRLFRWSQVNQHVFCWLTVGARARFLNLKESPVKLGLPGSTEFGSFWKILETVMLQLPEWSADRFQDSSPQPQCLFKHWLVFPNRVFLARSEWWPSLSKWVSQGLFLTWLHRSWIVWVFKGQHECEGWWK